MGVRTVCRGMSALLLCPRDDRRTRLRRRQCCTVLPVADGRGLVNGTRANLQVGDMLQGSAGNLSVRGCLLFKEWDTRDRCFYYWEEWQLIGGSNADTWVELIMTPVRSSSTSPFGFRRRLSRGPWPLVRDCS